MYPSSLKLLRQGFARRLRGSALVWGVGATLFTMGFSALVVDAGMMYGERTRIQRAADAAALAGASHLPSLNAATNESVRLASENGFVHGANGTTVVGIPNPDGQSPGRYRVNITREMPTYFGKMFGQSSVTIAGQATAAIMTPLEMTPPVNSVNNSFALMAGQHHHSGTVTVTNDANNLTFTYNTEGNWRLYETHLYVGTTVLNNPAPGSFPYKAEGLGGTTSHTFVVPNSWPVGTQLYLAAHAVVKNGTQSETAWGKGDCLAFQKKWGWYICYTTLAPTATGAQGSLAQIPAEAAGSKVYVNKYEVGPVTSVTYHDEHGNTWVGDAGSGSSWRVDVLQIPENYQGGELQVVLEGDANESSLWELYFEGTMAGKPHTLRLVD